MKPEKKGQILGSTIGLVIGAVSAYMIWGFNSPGGILILFGFGIGGVIGWQIGLKKKESGTAEEPVAPNSSEAEDK